MSETQTPQQIAEAKLDQIIAEVRRLAAENPTHIYETMDRADADVEFYGAESWYGLNSCLYIHKSKTDEEPTAGCIFGHAFLNVGYTIDQVKEFDKDEDAGGAATKLIGGDLDVEDPNVERKLEWCNTAQANQDRGEKWGRAIENADLYYGEENA